MIGIIRNDVLALKEYQLLDDDKRDALIIIITEMMTNAIKHGSLGIENALVILGVSNIEDTVICIFEDSEDNKCIRLLDVRLMEIQFQKREYLDEQE